MCRYSFLCIFFKMLFYFRTNHVCDKQVNFLRFNKLLQSKQSEVTKLKFFYFVCGSINKYESRLQIHAVLQPLSLQRI
ncbi:Uncharacterised protein [Klebsiella pneumoniae]|nr:Uncharacterised protein [Klebsiella pneumoniae]